MDEQDAAAIYQELAAMMNELKLNWATSQVSKIVQAGKTIEERSAKRNSLVLKIESYSPEEQLFLLINALEQAAVNTTEMEIEIAEFLRVEQENDRLVPEIEFVRADGDTGQTLDFTEETLAERGKQAAYLKRLLERLRQDIVAGKINPSRLQDIRDKLNSSVNSSYKSTEYSRTVQAEIFNAYIFSLLLKAVSNEDGYFYYKDVLEETPDVLTFRNTPGKIHTTTYPYTHVVVEFSKKPPLEIHLGIKIQGRSGVLQGCDLLVLYQKEADLCRLLDREPRSSQILLAINCLHSTSELTIDLIGSFLALASDIRVDSSYFVSNSESPPVAKLLTMARKKWEHNIFPGASNDVNRFMYSLQTLFKNFKAKY